MDQPHLYSDVPLGDTEGSIRVLDILPNLLKRPESEIEVELRIVELSTCPYYETLSYTWGSSQNEKSILVNGHRFPITDNLYSALRRLRKRRRKRTIWVDQICINQWDIAERSSQVARMYHTYEAAALVNVWLGEPGFTLPINWWLLDWMRIFMRISNLEFKYFPFGFFDLLRRETWRAIASMLLNHPRAIGASIEHSNPRWHERSWILQEFILSQKIFLCFGTKRCRYSEDWLRTLSQMKERSTNYGQYSIFLEKLGAMGKYREHRTPIEEQREWPYSHCFGMVAIDVIIELSKLPLRRYPNSHIKEGGIMDAILVKCLSLGGATDPKDYIYSALGFVAREEAEFIGCDYSLSCSVIYSIATVASIRYQGNFDILDWITACPSTPNLPSWAVDFAKLKECPSRHWSQDLFDQEPCRLPLAGTNKLSSSVLLDWSRGLLNIHGSSIDTIIELLPLQRRGSWRFGGFGLYINVLSAECTQDTIPEGNNAQRIMQWLRNVLDLSPQRRKHSKLAALGKRLGFLRDGVTITDQETPGSQEPDLNGGDLMSKDRLGYDDIFGLWTSLAISKGLINSSRFCRSDGKPRRPPDTALEQAESDSGTSERNAQLFVTASGLVGLASNGVSIGDKVVLIRSHHPFIALQEVDNEHTFQGQLYIHGFWDEELFEAWQTLDFEDETFDLV